MDVKHHVYLLTWLHTEYLQNIQSLSSYLAITSLSCFSCKHSCRLLPLWEALVLNAVIPTCFCTMFQVRKGECSERERFTMSVVRIVNCSERLDNCGCAK